MELLAITWGLIWALYLPDSVEVRLMSDSKCSLDSINMDAIPKRDQALAKTATVLWDMITRQRQASNEH
eukprot:4043619-Pyramimonas_sp.AAC.1